MSTEYEIPEYLTASAKYAVAVPLSFIYRERANWTGPGPCFIPDDHNDKGVDELLECTALRMLLERHHKHFNIPREAFKGPLED